MKETPDQYEAAIDALYRLLVLSVETPGALGGPDELRNWLRSTAGVREDNGDFGAARILDRLARKE